MSVSTFINYNAKHRSNTLEDLRSINSHVALSQGGPREDIPQTNDGSPLFFISENPASLADTTRNLAAVRSQVTKRYWRQTKQIRGGANEPLHLHVRSKSNSRPERPRRSSLSSWERADGEIQSSEQQPYGNEQNFRMPLRRHATTELRARRWDATDSDFLRDEDNRRFNPPFEFIDGLALYPNPKSFLGSGSEDPFRSYPSQLEASSVAKLTHHSIEELWPGLRASDPGGLENPLVKHWFVPSITNPSLFHALMFGAAVHFQTRKFLQQPCVTIQAVQEKHGVQYLQSRAIQHLNKAVQDPLTASTDEIICSVMILACSGVDLTQPRVTRAFFDPPLTSLQWLDVYATIDMVEMHFQGLKRLVDMRGGLENLKMDGVADIIVLGDLINASKHPSKPRFAWYSSYNPGKRHSSQTSIMDDLKLPAEVPVSNFWDTQQAALPEELLGVMRAMVDYVRTIESYCRGAMTKPNMNSITHQRNFAQHQLLSLPLVRELGSAFSQMYPYYESCRLAALIFGIGVSFPLPVWAAPFPYLASALQQALIEAGVENASCIDSDLLFWILVLGGIAATNLPVRLWFVSMLSNLLTRRSLDGWEQAQTILKEVLWLTNACDRAGRALWDEAARME